MEHVDLPDDYTFFRIGYCGDPDFLYARIQWEQATKLIISHYQEEYHPFIYDNLGNNTKLVWIYFVYRSNKNASRTDKTDDEKKTYTFVPTYGDVTTAFQRHMILFLVF